MAGLQAEYDRIMDAYRSWSEGGLGRPNYEAIFHNTVQANPGLLRYTEPEERELLMKFAIDRRDDKLIQILLDNGYPKDELLDFGGQGMTAYGYMRSVHDPEFNQRMGQAAEDKEKRITNMLNPNPAGGYRRKSNRGKSRNRKSKKSKKSKSKRLTRRHH